MPPRYKSFFIFSFTFDYLNTGPFSQRKENVQNMVGKFFASRNLAVDFLHFLNHKDAKCQEVFNPYVKELMPVNSVICEQKFARSNNYTNCKGKLQKINLVVNFGGVEI